MEKEYLALIFDSEYGNNPILKEWLIREGKPVKEGDALFNFGEGSNQKTFAAKAEGVFKVFLWKEGEALEAGCEVAVLQVDPSIARDCEKKKYGKIITPDEAKTGMTYAEAASIRLPPS